MWIIRIIINCILGVIFIWGGLLLIIPCFITWRWRIPYREFTKFLDTLDKKFFELEINTTVD